MLIQKILSKTLALLLPAILLGDGFENFKEQQLQKFSTQKKEFVHYKSSTQEAFKKYNLKQQKVYEDYKKSLLKYWDQPELSDKKRLIHYSDSKQTRTTIDFANKKLTIEAIAKNKNDAKKKLAHALIKAISIDTKELYKEDALLQKLSKIKKPPKVISEKINAKPILTPLLFKKPPNSNKLIDYTKKTINNAKIQERDNSKKKHIYTLNIKLPQDSNIKQSKFYLKEVKRAAQKELLSLSLIFAIIESESNFNPYARSYVPAYGLMQIVPKTAGIDAYYYLYKKKRLLSAEYLYNSRNNITIGSAYLHILFYNYLKDIKNPKSRLYCSIAAYNTGAGNVARTFVGSRNIKKAAVKINKMNPQDVYNHLLKNLQYQETKEYLKKVTQKQKRYKTIYGS
jgi:membrane-bound lytic murein transglycosylase C